MQEHDEGIPVTLGESTGELVKESAEGESTAIEDEKQIEQEVMSAELEEPQEDESSGWDGSESEFVEDNDAEEYEEHYAGIKFGYVLRKEEIFESLKHTGMFRANNTHSIVEAGLFTILALMFFIMFFLTRNNINIILGVISMALLFVSLAMPRLFAGLNVDKLTTGKKLSVEIYPDEIDVDGGTSNWKIPLDGSCAFEEFNEMFLLHLPQDKLFIIPSRAIEPDLLADVQAMIVAGTTPKVEE